MSATDVNKNRPNENKNKGLFLERVVLAMFSVLVGIDFQRANLD